jgi:hypothetical protein
MEEKPSLPIKTKISAKWLKIYSIVYLIFAVILYLITFPLAGMGGSPPRAEFLGFLLLILYPLFVLFFASSVLRGKKWSWWGIIVILSVIMLIPLISFMIGIFLIGAIEEDIATLFLFGLVNSIFIIVPFILLLLDRKNFWKVAK